MVVILLGDGDVVNALLVVQVVRVLPAEGPQGGHRRVVNACQEGSGHVALLDGRKQERARPQSAGESKTLYKYPMIASSEIEQNPALQCRKERKYGAYRGTHYTTLQERNRKRKRTEHMP